MAGRTLGWVIRPRWAVLVLTLRAGWGGRARLIDRGLGVYVLSWIPGMEASWSRWLGLGRGRGGRGYPEGL